MSDLDELIGTIKEYDKKAELKLVKKAYQFAKKSHHGQTRESGEDFFIHCFEVAKILAEFRADVETICAALLHDVIEDANVSILSLKKTFGTEIANLVEGETKITKVLFDSPQDYTAENLRKVLLATTKDIRVILIKLADRLHNMQTLKYLRLDKQKRIAKETLDIYAPIAHKLGMYSLKGILEDLSMRYLQPKEYQEIASKINEKREQREERAAKVMEDVRSRLKEDGVDYIEVSGRAKYFYSIYNKMKKEKKSFDEIYDLIAIRVIVKDIPDCYKVLAAIHQLWKPIPGRMKDYIAVPKSNQYQSLHTDVITPYGSIVEVQIRSLDMHYVAKYGVAAHWRYKGTDRDKIFDKRISWLEQFLSFKKKTSSEFLDSLKFDLFQDEIVVFTPKGDPIILPEGSTVIDFAYEIHSSIGDHCSKGEVNRKLVPLDTKLKNGDIANIITSNSAKPSRNWLTFIKTDKARSRIKNQLKIEIESRPSKKKTDIKANLTKYLKIKGKKSPIKISKCCNPQYQDDILAFRMKDRSITVHKKGCVNIHALDKSRQVAVVWTTDKDDFQTIKVQMKDKIGMLESILRALSGLKMTVLSTNIKQQKGSILVTFKVSASDKELLQAVEILQKHPNVLHVKT